MVVAQSECSRCVLEQADGAWRRFCPRCGAPADFTGVPEAIRADGRAWRVLDRIAVGAVANVYQCVPVPSAPDRAGGADPRRILKVARDARSNAWLANEATVLTRLGDVDTRGHFGPFLPSLVGALEVHDPDDGRAAPARAANFLANDSAIRSPDELYTLAEVRAARPTGLDGRDVAWIWRRLLAVLGFVHAAGVAHGAVMPPNVMIEPRDHKLVLVDWCSAFARDAGRPAVPVLTGQYLSWYRRQAVARRAPDDATDVAMGARCMIALLGGDPVTGECPATGVEPAVARYFRRCLGPGGPGGPGGAPRRGGPPVAARLLFEFDRLIETLWGPRTFRALALPPKPSACHSADNASA